MFKLHFKDKLDFIVVSSSDIPLNSHSKICAYYECLREILQNEQINPPEQAAVFLYDKFYLCYRRIFKLIDIDVDILLLEPIDLYQFFIATISGDRLGLSWLSQLLGYKEQGEPKEEIDTENSEEQPTTGDLVLDATVSTLLNFKHSGWKLIETYSLTELIAMNKMAGECYELAQAKAEAESEQKAKGRKNFKVSVIPAAPQPQSDRDEFTLQKTTISAKIEKLGKKIPTGF